MMSRLLAPVRLRALASVLAGSVALAGCAGQPAYDSSLSPAQNQLRQSNARFNQTVGEGAVAGALLGGVAGLLLGGNNRAGAAAIGATAGAALGGGAGYLVARNNLSRSSTEAQYADAIQQAQADAATFRSYADASRQVADQAYAEATRLRAQVRSGQISRGQYDNQIARYKADDDAIRTHITQAREVSQQMSQNASVSSPANRGQFLRSKSDVDASNLQLERSQARLSQALAGAA